MRKNLKLYDDIYLKYVWNSVIKSPSGCLCLENDKNTQVETKRRGNGVLTMLPGLSGTLPCCVIWHWVQISLRSHPLSANCQSRGRA